MRSPRNGRRSSLFIVSCDPWEEWEYLFFLQFPREVLMEAPRFLLLPTFPLIFLVFQ